VTVALEYLQGFKKSIKLKVFFTILEKHPGDKSEIEEEAGNL